MPHLFENLMRSEAGFLLLAALSLLVVLAALYRGDWRYLTGPILALVAIALLLAMLYSGVLAAIEYYRAFSGPPDRRSEHLTWALILTASSFFLRNYIELLDDDATPVGRFVKKLMPPMSE